MFSLFFFNAPATTEIYPLSLHDALPIWVEGVTLRNAQGDLRDIDCDGVLFTGRFIPESSLVRQSHLELDPHSGGPVIDQFGRCSDPAYFAAGNLLRPVETAGWSYREGATIGQWMLGDLASEQATAAPRTVRISCAAPIKLVVPQMIVTGRTDGMQHLQLRMLTPVHGRLTVMADDGVIWQKRISALPERRVLIPINALNIPDDCKALNITIQS
mgnify:CR=1 FL=1